MAALYSDEDFIVPVADDLKAMGHDVLTVFDDARAGLGIDDPDVLDRAIALGRAVLTHNRTDFRRLHRQNSNHRGIIICTRDADWPALAARIHGEILKYVSLDSQLIRVIRPNPFPAKLKPPPVSP